MIKLLMVISLGVFILQAMPRKKTDELATLVARY